MILPLKTARERAAEDALVDLVAGAVRLGVVDRRVVVDQLVAVGEVEAVQRAVAALAVEQRACASLRTNAPPSANECDEKRVLRDVCTCRLAMWNASSDSCCTL